PCATWSDWVAISLQRCSHFKITEYFVNFEQRCSEIATQSLQVAQGWINLPTAPGLGIDIDIVKLRAYPHSEASHHGLRQYTEEYPRKGYTPSLKGDAASP